MLSAWFSLTLMVGVGCGRLEPDRLPPDIVLISLDAVRQDHGPGPWGQGVMPQYAAFARGGVRFAQAWAPASNTLTSHYGLLSGLPAHAHSVHPGSPPPTDPPPLFPALKRLGYSTAVLTTHPTWLGQGYGFDAGADFFRAERVPGTQVVEWLKGWVAQGPKAPRAVFVHLYDAHSDTENRPYDAPVLPPEALAFSGCIEKLCASKLLRAVDDGRLSLPPGAAEAIRAGYGAGVREVDRLLGDVLKVVGDWKRPAVVAVFSDHGELLGEEGWLHSGSLPAVLDILLAVRWPAGPRGVVSQTPVSLVALYPTLLRVAGLPMPGEEDLEGLIAGPEDRTVVAMGAVRRGNRALVRRRGGAVEGLWRGEDGQWTAREAWTELEPLLRDPRLAREKGGSGEP